MERKNYGPSQKEDADEGVWSGVEGGITAEDDDDCEKLYAHTISSSWSHKADTFISRAQ